MTRIPEERLYFDDRELTAIEHSISRIRHIERYGMIRQWCYGTVVDCACGCGYGSYMIAKNPDVDKVYGIDNCNFAISWAKKNFDHEKVTFITNELTEVTFSESVDVLTSIETIEHIKDLSDYIAFIKNILPGEIILSYPSKKSVHYNKYHYHDLVPADIDRLFCTTDYRKINEFNLYNELNVVHMRRNGK